MIRHTLSAFLILVLFSNLTHAGLSSYFEDFEAMDVNDPNALSPGPFGDPNNWEYFNIVGGGLYSYGGNAPNIQTGSIPPPRISSVLAEYGGQHLNVFSDYENRDAHPLPLPATTGLPVVVNVLRFQSFDPSDIGSTWNLSFEHAGAVENGTDFSPTGATTTAAFIRVFDFGFNFLGGTELDTTGAPLATGGFTPGLVSQFFDPAWGVTDGFVQFGFTNTASNFEQSGIYYDNVRFARVPEPSAFLFLSVVMLGIGTLAKYRRRLPSRC